MNFQASKIALGTVQFGLDYGINNHVGQVSPTEVNTILKLATQMGIQTLDTAFDYGNSEKILGQSMKEHNISFQVVSKLPAGIPYQQIPQALEESLSRLQQRQLYGYLIHDFQDFSAQPTIWKSLSELKELGLIKKIGFSLYYPHQWEYLEKNNLKIDIIQVPYNILDQRFAPFFPSMKAKSIEIHTRSIFLQGLFFKPLEKLSNYFESIKPKLRKLHSLATQQQIPLQELLLGFGLQHQEIDRIIIGVDSSKQFKNNLSTLNSMPTIAQIYNQLLSLSDTDETILLPFRWEKST